MIFPYWTDVKIDRLIIITPLLIFVNFLVFGLVSNFGGDSIDDIYLKYSLDITRIHPVRDWLDFGALWLQARPFLTHQFMHASWSHLLSNMLILWIVGLAVENRMGAIRFLIFYLLCGAVGAWVELYSRAGDVLDPNEPFLLLGASRAISGVMGAHLVIAPFSNTIFFASMFFQTWRFMVPTIILMIVFIGQEFLLAKAVMENANFETGVAHWAHLGGFAAGLFFTLFFIMEFRFRIKKDEF